MKFTRSDLKKKNTDRIVLGIAGTGEAGNIVIVTHFELFVPDPMPQGIGRLDWR